MQIRDYDPRQGDFLQGDICFFPIPECLKLSADAVEIAPINGRLIIQEGEATGHHHAVDLPRQRRFKPERSIGDPVLNTVSPRLRKAFGSVKAIGTARLYRDPAAIEQLRQMGELTRVDLAIGIFVVERAAVVVGHQEHDGGRFPHTWTDDSGARRTGRFYVGRQVESAGAEERVVTD